jgi:hypothetical protein
MWSRVSKAWRHMMQLSLICSPCLFLRSAVQQRR